MPDVNQGWMVSYVKSLPDWQRLRVLDYGCGAGRLVRLLRAEGVSVWGTEVSDSYAQRDEANRDTAAQGWFRTFTPGEPLPFDEGSFDLILSNMVFEHIPDKAQAFAALRRVLAPGGRMYHHFPTMSVLREAHLGLPFVHWMQRGSQSRRAFAHTAYRLGFGHKLATRATMTPAEWTEHTLNYLDNYVHYAPYAEVAALFGEHFEIRHNEIAYCRFRAGRRPGLRHLLAIEPLAPLYERVFRRLAFVAVELLPKS